MSLDNMVLGTPAEFLLLALALLVMSTSAVLLCINEEV